MVDVIGSLIGGSTLGGNAIGAAIVRLRLDSSDYQRQMQTAQAQTTTAANSMGAATSKFAAISKLALLGVGAAAVAGAVLSVKAAIEANEAHLKLQNTFKNNEKLSDSSVEAFERQADSLRALTGVDDEAIISAQALLGQFELTGKEVQKLTPLIVDLSAKMGIDMEAAAKAVGKATQGSAGILQRYGIQVDEARFQTDAFGATVEALGKVQGFAAERAEAEPWRILASEFEELAEDVGQKLIPILRDLIAAFQDLMPVITPILGALGDVIALAAEAVSALAKVVTLQFDELESGFVDATARFKELVTAFDSGRITALEFANGINKLKEETGFNVELTKEWEFAIFKARQATLDSVPALERQATATEHVATETDKARVRILRFANMTEEEIRDWRADIKTSFDSFVNGLEDMTSQSDITQRDFERAMNHMQQDARQLSRAMKEIELLPDEFDPFVAFLSEQGPEWLIGFADLNKTQQEKFREQWTESNRKLGDSKQALNDITSVLKEMDNGRSKHTVTIQYEYVGFDPSKPGMQGTADARAKQTG